MADFQNFAQFTGEHNTVLPTLSDGEARALQLDSSGRLLVQADVSVELDAGDGDNVAISDGTNTVVVNGDGSLNTVESNSADILTAVQLIDNAVFSVDDAAGATDAGFHVLAVRDDALTTLTEADGDYTRFRTNNQGALWVQHDGDLTVTATDLDIRPLSHTGGTPDSVQIGDGTNLAAVTANNDLQITLDGEDVTSATHDNFNVNANVQVGDADATIANPVPAQLSDGSDTLAINADGSINVVTDGGGTETDASSDPTGDGLISLTAGPDVLVSIAVGAGTTYSCHGWSWTSDRQCGFRLEVYDGAVLVEVLRASLNSGANPGDSMIFKVPIEVVGAATRVIRISAQRITGTGGLASGGINGTLD